MRSAERLRYNLTVPRLLIAVVLLASVGIWAQTPRAEQQGAQLGVAAEHLQQGKPEQTIREVKRVLAEDPRSAPAHMLLGLAYLAMGSTAMIADAKAELQQALDIDPELLWARFYLARLYFDQGLTEKAQEQLERGLKQSPGFPDFLSLLGEVRRELGDPAASLELNRKALEADATMTPAQIEASKRREKAVSRKLMKNVIWRLIKVFSPAYRPHNLPIPTRWKSIVQEIDATWIPKQGVPSAA